MFEVRNIAFTYRSEPVLRDVSFVVSPGEAKNSWLTGTAAWNWYAISQFILGVRPDYDGLVVDPCIPKSLKGFRVTRRFRGATYEIEVRNPRGVESGVTGVTIDGREAFAECAGGACRGVRLPLFKSGVHTVVVTLG